MPKELRYKICFAIEKQEVLHILRPHKLFVFLSSHLKHDDPIDNLIQILRVILHKDSLCQFLQGR